MSKKLTPLAASIVRQIEQALAQERGGFRLVVNAPIIEPLVAPGSIPAAPPPGPLVAPVMTFGTKTTGRA